MHEHLDNSEALAAFIARKAEIDTVLNRLAALSANHFDRAPEEIFWLMSGPLAAT
jgi:hypothetical protein